MPEPYSTCDECGSTSVAPNGHGHYTDCSKYIRDMCPCPQPNECGACIRPTNAWRVCLTIDGEQHEGFLSAETQEEALRAFEVDVEGTVEEGYAERVNHLLVQRLRDYDTTSDPWGVGFKFSMIDEVNEIVADVQYDALLKQGDDEADNPYWHAARIRWLLEHPDEMQYPIEVDNKCHNGRIYAMPDILDGWHRFFAHLHAGRKTIRASYSGRVDLLEYLEGTTDELPEF
jgi:hypothetical protein